MEIKNSLFELHWSSGAAEADQSRAGDPKLLMNMKKILLGDWNAKYYQIFGYLEIFQCLKFRNIYR